MHSLGVTVKSQGCDFQMQGWAGGEPRCALSVVSAHTEMNLGEFKTDGTRLSLYICRH